MRFVSTAGRAPPANLRTALFDGLAPDGGLYQPASLEMLPDAAVSRLIGTTLHDTAFLLARHLMGDELDEDRLASIVEGALDFPIPLKRLDDRTFVLELFHGPTLAFKDVGARFMARLMAAFRPESDQHLTVLAATCRVFGSSYSTRTDKSAHCRSGSSLRWEGTSPRSLWQVRSTTASGWRRRHWRVRS